MDLLTEIALALFGMDSLVSPLYILAFIAVAGGIFVYRREKGSFFSWVFPAEIWSHKSTRLDIILFLIGRLMSVFGLAARFAVTPVVALWTASVLPWPPMQGIDLTPIMLGVTFWLVNDFSVYWVHRLHHQTKTLWPLHAVHHSAAVMTPITAYRQHPLGVLVIVAIQSGIIGLFFGIIVGTIDPTASLAEIAGANAFTVIAVLAMANFHHAHIWISYGRVFERILISPAQHQIHHSTAPEHYNRNYGGMLAIWDWMFGTLYLTGKDENLTLGLTEKGDAPLMTQRLDQTLTNPLLRILRRTR